MTQFMKPTLTIETLQMCAKEFCIQENGKLRSEYFGITDGKAVGTIVEHLFKQFLSERG